MTLTKQHVTLAQSWRGGIRREQCELLGVEWPPPHGWLRRMQGKDLPDDLVMRFVGMGEGGKVPRVRGKHGKDLAFGPGVGRKAANVIASFHAFLQHLDGAELAAASPALSQVFAKAKQRLEQPCLTIPSHS